MDIERYDAAGGIVFDDGKVLLLKKTKLGEMALPKGHIEAGETPPAAALRETMEETGFVNLEIAADLGVLQAQYPREGIWYIRHEYYFVMTLRDHHQGGLADYDDAEYDKSTYELIWVPVDEAEAMMSFEPARSFVRRAVAWWAENRNG
jgi:8-oxo-dGTP pyrophosphatase MutT (NUDIX family)